MLNGTLVAVQRAITCFTEHFFNKSEMVLDIPEALQPYIRTKAIEKPK
jgi:seryl-tRNA synthetase